jgi:hypothetical protein
MQRSEVVAWVALGCAVGAIGTALALRGSLSSVEAKLAALDRPPVKAPAEIVELKERLVALHDQLAAARAHAAGLAMELARTQQALARQPAFAAFEHRLLGTFRSGREGSALLPEGGDEKRGSDWLAMDLFEGVKGVDKLQAYRRRTGSHEGYQVRMCVRGVVGVPGRYGHMGDDERFFLVSEILAVDAAAEAACRSARR